MVGSNRKNLSGTTLDVYLYILTSKDPMGVRDVWRRLKLSSPSLAQYHINKLLNLKLIESTMYGKYRVNAVANVEVLKSFVLLGGMLIPRFVFYGAIISGLIASYLIFWPLVWDFRDLMILVVSLFSAVAFFVEAYNQYKGLRSIRF